MSDDSSLKREVTKSIAISGIGTVIGRGLNAAALVYILDVITEADLGVAMLSITIITMLKGITELGLGVALIQTKDIAKPRIDALFFVSFFISVAMAGLLILAAPLVGRYYEMPALTPLVMAHSSTFIMTALFTVPRSLLIRDLKFGRITTVETFSVFMTALTSIYLAYGGHGPWAIVGGELAGVAASLVGFVIARPYLPRWPTIPFAEIREMIEFGAWATASRLAFRFYIDADFLIVAKLFGEDVLGYYAFAYRLITDTARTFTSIAVKVAYPAFAKLQDDIEQLRAFLFGLSRVLFAVVGTAMLALGLFAGIVLDTLGFEQWMPAVPYIRLFAILGVARSVIPLVPQLMNARGMAKQNFYYTMTNVIVMPTAFLAGGLISGSAMGVAWAWVLGYPLAVLVLLRFGARALEMPLLQLLPRLFSGVLLLWPMFAVGFLARWGVSMVPSAWTLPAVVVAAIVTLGIGGGYLYLVERDAVLTLIGKKKAR